MDTQPSDLAEVVSSWVAGWALARGLTVTQTDAGALHARPDDVYRREEAFITAPTWADLVEHEARHRGDDRAWLTVSPPPDAIPEGLRLVNDSETLMAGDLTAPGPPARLGLVLDEEGGVVRVSFVVDGEQAASGVVAVVAETAVFDRILTGEAFRRQGFGSDVMAVLTAAALRLGARRALLVASPQGQALYRRLGWRTVAAMATYEPVRVRRTGDGR